MAEPLADIKLRWHDESTLLADDRRELLELFLDSIGVTSDVARDLMEVMLLSRAKDVPLSTSEVKAGVVELRRRRGAREIDYGLTDRNIQIWFKHFERIGLLDTIGGRHRFSGNKKPSEAFKKTRQVIGESVKQTERLLEKLENAHGIK